jgi:hypothetical protein
VLKWVLIVPELHPKFWRDVVMMMMHQKAIDDEFGLNAVLLIPMLVWCI